MPDHRRGPGPAIRVARATALGLALAALTAAGTAQDPPRGFPAGADTTLYLVLRAGPKENEKVILETLKKGLERSGATITGQPSIRPVSAAFFEEFAALVDRAANPDVAEAPDGVAIRMLPTRDTRYELKVKPTQVLKELRVTYQKGGEKKYTPGPPATDNPLVLTVPGRYAFTPEADDTPTAYEGDVAELGLPDAAVKGAWPAGDKYYVVTMRNFRGDRKLMFDVIQNPTLVANPLDNIQLGNDLLFAFASLNSSAGQVLDDDLDVENNLTISVPTIPRRNPRRVWVHFPLDEKEMQDARDRYRKFDSTELPAEIRKGAATADAPLTIGPKTGPRWIEVPGEVVNPGVPPARFVRKVKLDDLAELNERYPRVWMLQVWEFDAGKPEAILVEHPKDDRVYVLERERQQWQKGLQKAIIRPAGPKKGGDPKKAEKAEDK